METEQKLKLIAEKAKQDKKLKFVSLIHHINEESLAACYKELKKDKACGIDGVTVEEYGRNLEENIKDLIVRMKAKRYKPKPVRRVYIQKAGKKEKRSLGIPSVEDKLVQIMTKKILEAIFEQDFLNCSYGFRPKKNCHDAINRLDKIVMTKPINYIVEVDIRKFFDTVNHDWLLRCIKERVKDPNMLWLIRKILKAGVVEDGRYTTSKEGTPQGGNLSPLLANIYLHYILDLWQEIEIKPKSRAYMEQVRYCDDFVIACESRKDAEDMLIKLEQRVKKFGLNLSQEKTRTVKFGRNHWKIARRNKEKVPTFNFLGFTHYCTASRNGKFMVCRKTSKENLARKLKEIKTWLKKIRNMLKLKDWWKILRSKLTGHYSYFGISGNMRSLGQFYKQVISMVFKWINRRSQKKSMNWETYMIYLQRHSLPMPKIYHNMYTLSPVR